MEKFVIIADATCDLNEEFQKKYDITVIQGHIVVPGLGEISTSQNWERFTREDFFKALKSSPESYSTSPPNIVEYAAEFEKYVSQGIGVIAMTISAAISGSFGFAQSARESVLEKYPEAKIICIDSRRFGPGFGLMVVHAAMLRDEGKSLQETVDIIEERKNTFHQAGWLDDLSFVAKKGRMTHGKAFLGTLVGIKPIGEFDYNGLTTVIGKIKGAKAAYSALLDYIEKTSVDLKDQIVFIAHTDRYDQAEKFRAMIDERFHPKEIYVSDVFAMNGINVGPGLMAAYYTGKPISKDLSEEKKILEEASGS